MTILITDYEKLIFSVILQNALPSSSIPTKICAELSADKFSSIEHKLIYQSICDVVANNDLPTIPNLILILGKNLEKAGGEVYLRSLISFTGVMEVPDVSESWESWVRFIDLAGKVRTLRSVLTTYNRKLENEFESMLYGFINEEKSFEIFISRLLEDLQSSEIFSHKSAYNHISSLYDDEIEKLQNEIVKKQTNCLPVGWPSFADYGIPRIGVLNVLAGLTGAAKTQLALLILLGTAIHLYLEDSPNYVTYNALEDSSQELYRRMACALMGVDSIKLKNGVASDNDVNNYIQGLQFINLLPIHINDNSLITSEEFLLEAALLNSKLSGRRVLGVSDYIELFSDKNKNEELRLAKIARKLHSFALDNFSCELLLTQYPDLPNPEQIGGMRSKGARAIGQSSKVFMEIWNLPELMKNPYSFPNFNSGFLPDWADYKYAWILLHKNSGGSKGRFPMRWQPSYTRFNEISSPISEIYQIEKGVSDG